MNYDDLTILITETAPGKNNLSRFISKLSEFYPGSSIIVSSEKAYKNLLEKTHLNLSKIYLFNNKTNKISTNINEFNINKVDKDPLNIRNISGYSASVLKTLCFVYTEKFIVIDSLDENFLHLPGIFYKHLNENDFVAGHHKNQKKLPVQKRALIKTANKIAAIRLPKHARVKEPMSRIFGGKTSKLKEFFLYKSHHELRSFTVLFDILSNLPPKMKIKDIFYRRKNPQSFNSAQLKLLLKSAIDIKTAKLLIGLSIIALTLIFSNILVFVFGDYNISRGIRVFGKENPWVKSIFRFISNYGIHLYHTLFVCLILTGIFTKRKKVLKLGLVYILVQLIATIIINGGFKIAIGRSRPGRGFQYRFFTGRSRYQSFTSGHATDAFSSAGTLWGYLSSYWASLLFFFFSVLIGFSRIILGSHYFMDVVGGMTIGYTTGIVITYHFFRN